MSDDEALFRDGNYADYWLGQPPGTNTFLMEEKGWFPLELSFRVQRRREIEAWNRQPYRDGNKEELNDDSFVAMMRAGGERGGGLQGGTPELAATRAALIRLGRQAIAWEQRLMQAGR